MSFGFESDWIEDDLSGEASDFEGFVTEPGLYHMEVIEPPKRNEDGTKLEVKARVLAGSATGQKGKQTVLKYFLPSLEKPEMAQGNKKNLSFVMLALDLISPGSKQLKDESAVGRQFLVKLKDREHNGNTYVDPVKFSTFHVDDPRGKDVPKCKASIDRLPANLRHPAEYFPGQKPASQQDDVDSL